MAGGRRPLSTLLVPFRMRASARLSGRAGGDWCRAPGGRALKDTEEWRRAFLGGGRSSVMEEREWGC